MKRLIRLVVGLTALALAAAGMDYVLGASLSPKTAAAGPTTVPATPRIFGRLDPAVLFTREFDDTRSRAMRRAPIRGLFSLRNQTWWVCVERNPTGIAGDFPSGRIQWFGDHGSFETTMGSPSYSAACGMLYAPLGAGGVMAIDDRTLSAVWTSADSPVDETALAGSTVLALHRATVRGLDAISGQARWSYTAARPLTQSLAVSPDGRVVVLVEEGYPAASLIALSATTGKSIWTRTLPFMYPGAPGVGARQVVIADIASSPWTTFIASTDLATGQAQWESRFKPEEIGVPRAAPSVPAQGRPLMPAMDATTVYQPIDNRLLALDGSTGKLRWLWNHDLIAPPPDAPAPPPYQNRISSPLLEQGRLFMTTASGGSAIDSKTGKELWRFEAPRLPWRSRSIPFMPVRMQDGLLFANDSSVAAIRADNPPAIPKARTLLTAQPIAAAAAWGIGGFMVAVIFAGLLLHRRRAATSGVSLLLLAGTAFLWFDSYQASRFIGRKSWNLNSSITAESRSGIFSRQGQLIVGHTNMLWNIAIRPPVQGDPNTPLWLTRSGMDDPTIPRAENRFAWLNASRPSGSDLGPQAIHGVVIPHWPLAALFAIAPMAWLSGSWRDRKRHPKGHCVACGYDLRGSEGGCPECGDGRDLRTA